MILANLNLFNSRKTFSIVLVSLIPPMELIVPTLPQHVLQFMTLNTLMVHAYQIVPILTEVSGMMEVISVTLLALLDISIP